MRGWGGARRGRGCAGALEGEAPLHPSAPKSGAGAPACGRVLRHLFASPRGIYSRHACLAITSPARRLGGTCNLSLSEFFIYQYKVVTDS